MDNGYIRIGSAAGEYAFLNYLGQIVRGSNIGEGSVPDFSEFHDIATKKTPQEYNLPLADGFTALSGGTKYCKTQENIVIVNIRCKANSSLSPSGNTITIGNLPSSFRPSGFVSTGAVFDANDLGGKYVGGITVTQDGKVNANQQNNSWQFCYATIIFVAT